MSTELAQTVRVGVDVGGTFTDVAMIDSRGRLEIRKVPSTPPNHSEGVLGGLASVLGATPPDRLEAIAHATTVGTNAIVQRRGAHTGLITTDGFRDVLELGRIRLSELYNLRYEKPTPLVRRAFRRVLTERMLASGVSLVDPDREEVEREVEFLVAAGVESLAICLLNSHVSPENERIVAAIVAERYPELPVSLSSELVPEAGEYERTSTAVINAYLQPVVSKYLESIEVGLRERGVTAPVDVMQSSGGLMTLARAMERPCHLVESGPAAGVLAARRLVNSTPSAPSSAGAIVFDMGGTTAKASVVEDGDVRTTSTHEVGGRLSEWGGFMGGGGYPLKLPVIDIAEIGAGGGSLLRVDSGGALHVGPESAGADPGPACYGRGSAATVTDANVVLGYLNPLYLLGGELELDHRAAEHAVQEQVGRPLGLDVHEAAWNAHVVSNSSMLPAIKAVTSQRGRDPRDFVLLAFGGSGPVHAAGLAQLLDVPRVVVPRNPGVFSALGLLAARHLHSLVRSFFHPYDGLEPHELERVFVEHEHAIRSELTGTTSAERLEVQRSIDLRYVGQGSELTIPLGSGPVTAAALVEARRQFEDEHERTYRHRSDEAAMEIVAIRVMSSGPEPAFEFDHEPQTATESASSRLAFFGPAGAHEMPVLARSALGTSPQAGPLVVEEYDATTVVPPGCTAHLDPDGNIIIDIG